VHIPIHKGGPLDFFAERQLKSNKEERLDFWAVAGVGSEMLVF